MNIQDKNGKKCICDSDGVIKQPWIFDNKNNTEFIIKDGCGNMGIIDYRNGKTIVGCRWQKVEKFRRGFLFKVMDCSGMWGLVNSSDVQLSPCVWSDIKCNNPEYYLVQDSKGKWGVLGRDGNVLILCKWDKIKVGVHSDSPIYIKDDSGKYGICDRNGLLLSECKWVEIKDSSYWFFVKGCNGHWGVLNKSGHQISPNKWKKISWKGLGNMLHVTEDGGLTGMIDGTSGKILIPCQYKDYKRNVGIKDQFIVSDKNGRYGVYTETKEGEPWEFTIPCEWTEAFWGIGDHLIVRNSDGYYGVIKNNGSLLIPCVWNMITTSWHSYERGAFLLNPCVWNMIITGTLEGLEYSMFYCVRGLNGLWGAYNHNGRQVLDIRWRMVFGLAKNLLVQNNLGRWGATDMAGHIIIPCQTKNIHLANSRFMLSFRKKRRYRMMLTPGVYDESIGLDDIYKRSHNKGYC